MAKYKVTPRPGSKVQLTQYDPDYHEGFDKASAEAEVDKLKAKIEKLQERLYAEGKQSLLIVFQAMDTGGKDGVIRSVFSGVNPLGVQVTSFKAPTSEELAHDFLWRVHKHTPGKGYIGVFNRSHYEDVLIVRVNNLVSKPIWKARYDHINNFEANLAASATRILKFYLHISKEEQKERLLARLADPKKHWKFSSGDLPVREQWAAYMEAYEAMLENCNTDSAPWHIVPSNHKWYRDVVVARAIVGALEDMNPRYPVPEAGLDKIVIPD
ncbi:MAG: polyphosphate kinase 2 family protein [Chloroflexi bacterium]|nr:polyphosphate kinase 2 family protein [Chloroflexota bacterium]MCC6895518.1 polyphosphate kinase 2 family protein [Anaerolineae bacterium]